jgi:hypothetical protein
VILILCIVISSVVGLLIGIAIGAAGTNPYNNPNHTPLADAQLQRLMERTQDYYNNPVVEYMKRKDSRR